MYPSPWQVLFLVPTALALPTLATFALLACGVAVFMYAAGSDERAIARSKLADDYAGYRLRVGRFVPRLGRR